MRSEEYARAALRMRKERQGYYDEKNGKTCTSYSARNPAYKGTTLQAKRGGTDENIH